MRYENEAPLIPCLPLQLEERVVEDEDIESERGVKMTIALLSKKATSHVTATYSQFA